MMKKKCLMTLFCWNKKPWWIILSTLLISLLLFPGLKNLKTNYNMRYWLDKSAPLIKGLDYFERHFGSDETIALAIESEHSIFENRVIKLIHDISKEIEDLEDIEEVYSLLTYEYLEKSHGTIHFSHLFSSQVSYDQLSMERQKKIAMSNSVVNGIFIDSSEKMNVIMGRLVSGTTINGEYINGPNYRTLVSKLNEILKRYQKNYPEYKFYLSGTAVLQNDFHEVSESDINKIMPLTFLAIILILFYIFKSFVATIFPIVLLIVTNLLTFSIAGFLGIEIENLVSAIPLILLTCCIGNTIHFCLSYYNLWQQGKTKEDAINNALDMNFIPIILTSSSTALGFSGLIFSSLVPIRNLGILGTIGTIIACLLTLTLLPALINIFAKRPKHLSFAEGKLITHKLFDFNYRFKNLIISIFITLSLFSIFVGTFCVVNTDPLTFFSDRTPSKIAANKIISTIGPLTGPELILHSGVFKGAKDPAFLKKADKFVTWLKSRPKIHKALSLIDILIEIQKLEHDGVSYPRIPETEEEISQIVQKYDNNENEVFRISDRVTKDLEALRITLMWGLTDTKGSLIELNIIEKKAKELGLNLQVTGKSALYLRMNDYVVRSFFQSALISAVLITLLIAWALRSWKMGLLAMTPNIVPISFILGIMWLLKINIDMGTTIVCSVCLGVAVDDTIHFTYHYLNYLKAGLSVNEALKKVLSTTGKSLLLTTGLLVGGFSLFLMADFIPNFHFGLLASLGMLLSMAGEMLFFPALLIKKEKS